MASVSADSIGNKTMEKAHAFGAQETIEHKGQCLDLNSLWEVAAGFQQRGADWRKGTRRREDEIATLEWEIKRLNSDLEMHRDRLAYLEECVPDILKYYRLRRLRLCEAMHATLPLELRELVYDFLECPKDADQGPIHVHETIHIDQSDNSMPANPTPDQWLAHRPSFFVDPRTGSEEGLFGYWYNEDHVGANVVEDLISRYYCRNTFFFSSTDHACIPKFLDTDRFDTALKPARHVRHVEFVCHSGNVETSTAQGELGNALQALISNISARARIVVRIYKSLPSFFDIMETIAPILHKAKEENRDVEMEVVEGGEVFDIGPIFERPWAEYEEAYLEMKRNS
ncbi:hypothetical protein P280DRAFT_520860 [Massarina eburnea CBS 473.64]|uniref:Uncharacterized protein n=1 Tax=Massarina eburnea CBS 473.64 TaxID=1395130 RepID=A0A6A6RRI6_9PLEO|nr:hypothetical protein P280DRAFT_520860 [Massarina eburnea CBS 473.64]